MLIKATRNILVKGKEVAAGSEIEVEKRIALDLIAMKRAAPVEKATPPPKPPRKKRKAPPPVEESADAPQAEE